MENQKRMEIQRQITEIDRKMGELLDKDKGRAPRLNTKDASFPIGYFVLFFCLVGWWLAGGSLHAAIHSKTSTFTFYFAIIVLLLSIWRVFRWVMNKFSHKKSGYNLQDTDEVAKLRQQRDALRKQLEALNKAEK